MRRSRRRREAFELALFALVRLKAYEPLAAAVLGGRSPGQHAGGPSRTRCSASTIRARHRRCCSSLEARAATRRVRGARARRAEADVGRHALTAAARRKGQGAARGRGQCYPRARRRSARRLRRQRSGGTRVTARDRPERAARGGRGARRHEATRRPRRRPGSARPTTGRRCAPRRSARPRRSIPRPSRSCCPAGARSALERARGAGGGRSARCTPEVALDAAAQRCCRTRTSASSARCSARSSSSRRPTRRTILAEQLKDSGLRRARRRRRGLGKLKPPDGAGALREAYTAAQADSVYVRARRDPAGAGRVRRRRRPRATLKTALTDKDWAVRVRRRSCSTKLDPATDARAAIRPAPGTPVVAVRRSRS